MRYKERPRPAARLMRMSLAVLTAIATIAYGQGNSWDKVRYKGGTLETKVDSDDWNNRLTVTPDTITFRLKDGQVLEIPASNVTSLSYGQEAHRRVGTMAALGILVSPVALFGLFHKTRLHFIGVEYTIPDGKRGGLLLQGHKDNYRAILMALKSATGASVSVSQEDAKYLPIGIEAAVVSPSSPPTPFEIVEASQLQPAPSPTGAQEVGELTVTTLPENAEIHVDGAFVGNSPATLKLSPGVHTISVVTGGYQVWTRQVTIISGSQLTLSAALERLE